MSQAALTSSSLCSTCQAGGFKILYTCMHFKYENRLLACLSTARQTAAAVMSELDRVWSSLELYFYVCFKLGAYSALLNEMLFRSVLTHRNCRVAYSISAV